MVWVFFFCFKIGKMAQTWMMILKKNENQMNHKFANFEQNKNTLFPKIFILCIFRLSDVTKIWKKTTILNMSETFILNSHNNAKNCRINNQVTYPFNYCNWIDWFFRILIFFFGFWRYLFLIKIRRNSWMWYILLQKYIRNTLRYVQFSKFRKNFPKT